MSTLVLDCNTVTDKTTGMVTITADWTIKGLEADIAAISHYEVRVHWAELHNNVPVLDTNIRSDTNVSAPPVS